MSLNLNENLASILRPYRDVIDDKSSTNWAVFEYENLTNTLTVVGKGENGIEEMKKVLNDGKVMYALCQVLDSKTNVIKYVLINWQGEEESVFRKVVCADHICDLWNIFKGVHYTVIARTKEDVDIDNITKKLDGFQKMLCCGISLLTLKNEALFSQRISVVGADENTCARQLSSFRKSSAQFSEMNHTYYGSPKNESKDDGKNEKSFEIKILSNGTEPVEPKVEAISNTNLGENVIEYRKFLEDAGIEPPQLSEYVKLFAEHHVMLNESLLTYTDEKLKEMGIKLVGDQLVIMIHAERIFMNSNPSSLSDELLDAEEGSDPRENIGAAFIREISSALRNPIAYQNMRQLIDFFAEMKSEMNKPTVHTESEAVAGTDQTFTASELPEE